MTTKKRNSHAMKRKVDARESIAIRAQLDRLETLNAVVDSVDSKMLTLLATYRPELLRKARAARIACPDCGNRIFVQGERNKRRRASLECKEDATMTVWIYIDTSKQIGHPDHLKVFTSQDAASEWFEDHDLEGVAFEYPVMGRERMIRPPVP